MRASYGPSASCPLLANLDLSIHTPNLAALAHPGAGEAAEQEQQAEQAGEDRQHADAAHHAGVAHFQADPVVALVGVAGAYRDDARNVEIAAVVEPAGIAAGRIG